MNDKQLEILKDLLNVSGTILNVYIKLSELEKDLAKDTKEYQLFTELLHFNIEQETKLYANITSLNDVYNILGFIIFDYDQELDTPIGAILSEDYNKYVLFRIIDRLRIFLQADDNVFYNTIDSKIQSLIHKSKDGISYLKQAIPKSISNQYRQLVVYCLDEEDDLFVDWKYFISFMCKDVEQELFKYNFDYLPAIFNKHLITNYNNVPDQDIKNVNDYVGQEIAWEAISELLSYNEDDIEDEMNEAYIKLSKYQLQTALLFSSNPQVKMIQKLFERSVKEQNKKLEEEYENNYKTAQSIIEDIRNILNNKVEIVKDANKDLDKEKKFD